MLILVASLVLGVALLYFGAEWLVRGAAGLAHLFGIRPLVIGLTVVAYGTSAPELVVSAFAAWEGSSAIALGNVVGSNIANLALILGLTAIVAPLEVERTLLRREIPVMLLTSASIPLLLWNGSIGRLEGLVLLAGAALFTVWTLRPTAPALASVEEAEEVEEATGAPHPRTRLAMGALTAVGLVVMLAGGRLFVHGAEGLALIFGISERVVGLTVVAVGTSLPELAASMVAALRGHAALAVGNVVGSNIFNVLFVLGGASVVHPIEGSARGLALDFAVLLAVSVLGAIMMRTSHRVTRAEGGVLTAGYAAFVGWLVLQAT